MIITCENCSIRFNLDETLLKPAGSKVRCSKCQHIFFAFPPPQEEVADRVDESPEDIETRVEAEAEEEVDFSDLEKMLDSDKEAEQAPAVESEDSFSETEEISDEVDDDDEELDLSGLDDMLDSETETDGTETDGTEADGIDEDDETLADFDLEPEDPGEDETDGFDLDPDKSQGEEGLEDLDLELDDDFGHDDKYEETIESDLLETGTVEEIEDTSDELELDIDENSEPNENEIALEEEEEIDLSELEQTLEMELLSPDSEIESDEEPENVELELAADDIEEETAGEGVDDLGPDEEVDASDIEELLETDTDVEQGEEALADVEELELDFDIDEKAVGTGEASEPAAAVEKEVFSFDDTQQEDPEEDTGAVEKATQPVKKKKTSPFLVVLLVLVLLGGAVFGGYYLLISQGVKLPTIDELLKSGGKKEVGAMEVMQNTISSEFVNNKVLGKLFVITGEVKNTTSKAYHSIKITAKLYSTGKKLVKSKTTYCGNVLSDSELSDNDLSTINRRLGNKFATQGELIRLKAGTTLPFMIAIPNLPDNLEEYKVMISASIPE